MPTLRETARRNEVAADLLAQEAMANAAIDQLVAVKGILLALRTAVQNEPIFTADEAQEVTDVVTALASRVQNEVL